jgi:transcription initiation factor TFIIB
MSDLWATMRSRREETPLPGWDDGDLTLEGSATTTNHTCAVCEDDDAVQTVGAEVVCTRCGTIIDIPLECGAEYRWFSADSGGGGADPSRCGFPINHLMPESSLGTMILNNRNTPVMRSIKRYHSYNLMPYRERALWNVFDSLNVRATNAGISNAVIEEAKELYAQLTASAICRGQPQRDAMLAACLWESLKRHDSPRMPKDIAEIFFLPLKAVTKGIKQFQHLLAIRTSGNKTDTYAAPDAPTATKKEKAAAPPPPVEEAADVIAARAAARRAVFQRTAARTTSYEDFIQPFLTNLAIPRTVATTLEEMVARVCARTEELNIVPENTPPSLTASVIAFCAAELHVRLETTEIARVCGISAVTIQKCLKRLAPWREQLLS